MGKYKIKKIVPKGLGDDQETMAELFEQMTGVKDADVEILVPKYSNVMTLLSKIYKLYNLLANLDVFKNTFADYTWVDEINIFLNELKKECELNPEENYHEDEVKKTIINKFYKDIYNEEKLNHQKLTDAELQAKEYINKIYKNVKNSKIIKQLMITSANLSPFKVHLCADEVKDTFILREPGNTFTPLAFTSLDLKLIWIDADAKCKKFLLSILQHTFKLTYEIYDIVYSPDVDIAKFSDLLINTISKLRSQIPRCDKAFDVIEKSVNMLKTNFKDYFRISIESENPSSILESFIIDVAQTQNANPVVVTQFRKITAFMKKNASNSNDPRVKQLFKMLNNQFTKIDKELNVNTEAAAAVNVAQDVNY